MNVKPAPGIDPGDMTKCGPLPRQFDGSEREMINQNPPVYRIS